MLRQLLRHLLPWTPPSLQTEQAGDVSRMDMFPCQGVQPVPGRMDVDRQHLRLEDLLEAIWAQQGDLSLALDLAAANQCILSLGFARRLCVYSQTFIQISSLRENASSRRTASWRIQANATRPCR
jgi:hypothetical protein